jgi:hypothetical protein
VPKYNFYPIKVGLVEYQKIRRASGRKIKELNNFVKALVTARKGFVKDSDSVTPFPNGREIFSRDPNILWTREVYDFDGGLLLTISLVGQMRRHSYSFTYEAIFFNDPVPSSYLTLDQLRKSMIWKIL